MRGNRALTAVETVDSKGGLNSKFYDFLEGLFRDIRSKSYSN